MSCDLNSKQAHCNEIKSLNAKLTYWTCKCHILVIRINFCINCKQTQMA